MMYSTGWCIKSVDAFMILPGIDWFTVFLTILPFQFMANGPRGHLGPHAILIVFISGDEHVTTHIQPMVADTVLAAT